jgi:uncharacterized membrane protein YgaE (UPF0421/DUF939 family)
MTNKEFWKSKVFWTQLLGFLSATLAAVIPTEYNAILTTAIALITAILTVAFRWGSDTPLGWKK